MAEVSQYSVSKLIILSAMRDMSALQMKQANA